ncbi:MAG: glycosyltransferase [Planctomycetes bacterium]|nr:glycosyltransferase [Planctomycetota bacterium]
MRVSVIIPTFNRAALLARAVDSVLDQDWRPLELVIIDDGSSDETPSVLDALGRKADEADVRLLAIRQPNKGDAGARNAGIDASTGDWIAFLDDDDTRRPGTLTAQLDAAGSAGVCCALVAKGDRAMPAAPRTLMTGNCAAAFLRGEMSCAITSLLVRRDVAAATGRFDTSLPVGSDMEWIARLAHYADFAALPEIVADYNRTENALSRFSGLDQLIARDAHDLRVVGLILERCGGSPRFEHAAWSIFAARTYDRCVKHLLYAGQIAEAARLLQAGHKEGADVDILRRTGRKVRHAKLLALVGRRVRHPKFRDASDIQG